MSVVADRLYARRKFKNAVALLLSTAATLFGLFWLAWILWTTVSYGIDNLNLALFTQMTPPPGDTGGMLNAFFGSMVMSLLAIAMGTPIGIAAGTYLAEYDNYQKIGTVIRFVNDILLSAPSIVLGLFVYTIVVDRWATSPVSPARSPWPSSCCRWWYAPPTRCCGLVPAQMREAALSLGVPQWKVTTQVLYRASMSGILTGVLLALARITEKTAPLLFTALNNQYWTTNLLAPMANVPV